MTGKLPCPECTVTNNNKIVVLAEKTKQLRVINNSQKEISKIDLDNCVFKGIDTFIKCDYIVEIKEKEDKETSHALYVELKGKDVKHAIEQIKSMLLMFKDRHKKAKKSCFIIASAVPRASTLSQIAQKRLKEEFSASILIRENSFEVNV